MRIRNVLLLAVGFALSSSAVAFAGLMGFTLQLNENFIQTTSGVNPQPGATYFFFPNAFMQTALDFDSAALTYNGPGSPLPLVPGGLGLSGSPSQLAPNPVQDFPSLAALNTAFPFGSYTLTATNSITQATQSATLNYASNILPSTTPAITAASFAAMQSLNASSPFDVQFDSFSPGSNDPAGTQLVIFNSSGGTVFSQSLGPTATDVALPAGTLAAGSNYFVRLTFVDGIKPGIDPVSHIPTLSLFAYETFGTFTTGAGPTPPVTLVNVSGGTFLNPVNLPPGPPIASVSGPIGGDGAVDFYDLYWNGGVFESIASIAGANPLGSYEFELFNPDGSINMELALNAGDAFTAEINELLGVGIYEIGIVADSPSDPLYTIDFVTPVAGVPEPTQIAWLFASLAGAVLISPLRRLQPFVGHFEARCLRHITIESPATCSHRLKI